MSIMENKELWHFQIFLDLIIKYLRPSVWLTHPSDENENQSMFLGGLAYSVWVQNYYQGIMCIFGMATNQHHLKVKNILW